MEGAKVRTHNAQATSLCHCSAISWQSDGKRQLSRAMNDMGLKKDKTRRVLLEFPVRSAAADSRQN